MSENIFEDLKEFMFTNENMERFNKKDLVPQKVILPHKTTLFEKREKNITKKEPIEPIVLQVKQDFMPFQKDKLFWCFYIILFGYEEYELNKNNAFIVEKKIKINAIEKLRGTNGVGTNGVGTNGVGTNKLGPKQLAEMEDELCNQPSLTIKGLNALCICHNVSIFYVDQRKYYDLNILAQEKKGIIVNRSLKYDLDEAFVRENYLHIENINKPIKAVSGYTIKELQAICKKLDIAITDENGKNKLKNVLYQDILAVI
jgi:hypothetical protein